MIPLDDDLDVFFEGFDVVVVFGITTTKGIFDRGVKAEDFVQRGSGFAPVMAEDPSVLVKSSLGAMVDSSILVDGRPYVVRDRESSADGRLMRLLLKEA